MYSFLFVLYSLKAESIYFVLVHLYYLNAARCTICTCRIWLFVMFVSFGYFDTCYTCLYFFHFCLSLFTKYHQVYEMYVAGFKFHLLNNAFTSHWGFQVQQDKVLLKTTKDKRLIIRKIIRKNLISWDFNNHLTALALADRKITRTKCFSRVERKTKP